MILASVGLQSFLFLRRKSRGPRARATPASDTFRDQRRHSPTHPHLATPRQHFCPRALRGLFGYPEGAAAELMDSTAAPPLLTNVFPNGTFLVLMVKVVVGVVLLLLLLPLEIMLLFGYG